MSTVNTGWLKDNNGEKFAPMTLTSQVINEEGKTLESIIQDLPNSTGGSVGGSGGSEADLVIRVNKFIYEEWTADDVEIIKGDILSIYESLMSKQSEVVKVEVHIALRENLGSDDEPLYGIQASVLEGSVCVYGESFTVSCSAPYYYRLFYATIEWNIATNSIFSISNYEITGTAV